MIPLRLLRISRIVALCLLFFAPLGAQNNERALLIARSFVDAIVAKDQGRAAAVLAGDIRIQYFSRVELKKKVDAMVSGELGSVDYLKTVTGYNAYKFFREFDGKTWDLSAKMEWPAEVSTESMVGAGSGTYFFVKIPVIVTETGTASQTTRTLKRVAEIDLIQEGDTFRVFGFIL